jgi:hypothetical protein
MVMWYIFSGFGMLHREKSGIPGLEQEKRDMASTLSRGVAVTKREEYEKINPNRKILFKSRPR